MPIGLIMGICQMAFRHARSNSNPLAKCSEWLDSLLSGRSFNFAGVCVTGGEPGIRTLGRALRPYDGLATGGQPGPF